MNRNRLRKWLEEPVTTPRHLGHSRWHLFSPSYHLWRWRNPWRKPNEKVSEYWQEMRSPERDILGVHQKYLQAISKGTRPYQRVADLLDSRQISSVLDVGCGDGIFLRYLIEEKGMSPDSMWGCDLDPKRVRNAQRQVYIAASGHNLHTHRDDLAAMERISHRIFQFDLLGTQPWPDAVQTAGVDIVTLFAFTTSFNDSEMNGVARRVAEFHPRRVIDVSLYENILEGYGGRLGIERFFAPYGYRQTHFEWLPERLMRDSLRFLWQNRPYWSAQTLQILERERS